MHFSILAIKDCHWTHSMGHYMMSCISVIGHKDCHWTHSMVIIWCHAIQLLVIKIVIDHSMVIEWRHPIQWSSRLSFNSFNDYMMSCYSVTVRQDCHWTHQWSLYDVMLFSNWSSRLSLNSFNGHLYDAMLFSNWSSRLSLNSFNGQYMMSCYSVSGHQDCHWTHSMVIMWCHAFQ